MLNLGRMAIILLLLLSVVYVCIYLSWRASLREQLAEDWVMKGRPGTREAWVEQRAAPKLRRINRWLIVTVYVLPITALGLFVYITN
ncbi:MAG: hypothetical protein GDA52_10430 [Rhodobacteraceae bacterium]|nr:hypothetical protein [Paracoccaceae bacterium]